DVPVCRVRAVGRGGDAGAVGEIGTECSARGYAGVRVECEDGDLEIETDRKFATNRLVVPDGRQEPRAQAIVLLEPARVDIAVKYRRQVLGGRPLVGLAGAE